MVNHGNGEILKVVIDYSDYHISCMHVFIQTWHVIIPISQTMCTLVKCFDILLEQKNELKINWMMPLLDSEQLISG